MLGDDPCKISLYTKGGTFLADLTRYVVEGTFQRRKRTVSQFSGVFTADDGNTADLAKIDYWSTQIVCERDGRDQWSGRVTNVVFDGTTARVSASDKTRHWIRAELPGGIYSVKDVSFVAEDLISRAFATDIDSLPSFVTVPVGSVISKTFSSGTYKYLNDALEDLPGLTWTAFGDTVFLFGLEENANSIVKLDDRSWSPLPSVERAGQLYANRVAVVGKGAVGIAEAPADEISYYGEIYRRYEAPDVSVQSQLNALAESYLARSRDSTYFNTDQASVLSPKVNISLASLIPGQCVDVDHVVGIYSLRRQLRIDGVDVDCVSGQVSLLLEPLSVPEESS